MNSENAIETHYRKLADSLSNEYEKLYELVSNEKLRILFSTLHARVVRLFDIMNQRLPTTGEVAHFWADPSRELIQTIEIIKDLERSLKESEFSFGISDYYSAKISFCNSFLKKSGGSSIPPNTEKLELYYTIPIFFKRLSVVSSNKDTFYDLKLIGEGSYAHVYKYFDVFYQRNFALKRAKKELDSKEILRFRREYDQMRSLSSPYVLEVLAITSQTPNI